MMNLQALLEYLSTSDTIGENKDAVDMMRFYSREAQKITMKINTAYHEPDEIIALFSELTGKPVDPSFRLFPPFYTDFGKNITLGKNVFINAGCKFQDQGGIYIDDGALIGHNVVLATLNHDFAPEKRQQLHPGAIHIGKNVWIGANAVVGSDVEAYSVVVGNPARKIRNRFDDELIELLELFKWWDKSIDEIQALIPILTNSDLDKVRSCLREKTRGSKK